MADNIDIVQMTLSPACNFLLDNLYRVLSGEITIKDFPVVNLEEQLAVVNNTKNSILPKLEDKNEDICFEFPLEKVQDIRESLDEYENAINKISEFLQSGNSEIAEEAIELIKNVGMGGRLIFEPYSQEDAEVGPTSIPIVNVLIKLCSEFFAGNPNYSKEAILRTIANVSANACLGAYELDHTGDSEQDYENGELIDAYCDFSDAVLELEPLLDVGPEAIDKQMEEVTEAGEKLKEVINKLSVSSISRGPSKMGNVNIILNLAKSWKSGELSTESFSQAVDTFYGEIDDLNREIEVLFSIPNESQEIKDQIEPCRKAFSELFEAIEMFRKTIKQEEDLFEEATDKLTKAANALMESKEKFDAIGEEADQVPCIHCGAYNYPGAKNCGKCGARMLTPAGMNGDNSIISYQEETEGSQQVGKLIMTQNLVTVFEAVNKVSEGKIDANEYCQVLNWFTKLIEDNLINMPPEPEVDVSGLNEDEVEQVRVIEASIANSREGIEIGAREMLDAVEHMRQYVVDSNIMDLVDGVRELRDAAIKVQTSAKEIGDLINDCKRQAGLPVEEDEQIEDV